MTGGVVPTPLSVLIVGCGRIAGGYDAEADDDALIRTHAKAYRTHGSFRLAGCVEPDPEMRSAFARRWGIEREFASLEEALRDPYDVVSLCTPPQAHAGLLRRLTATPVKLVFCEKPLTDDLDASRRLVAAYADANRLLAINYQRRWDPSVQAARREIAAGRWGRLLAAHGLYTKGIFANGSHLIDLLHYLVGPLRPVSVGPVVHDYQADDPTLGAQLVTTGGAPVTLSVGDRRCFTVFELDLLFERGRVTFGDSGFTVCQRRVVDDPRYRDYRVLEPPVWRPTGLGRAILHAVANIHDAIAHGAGLVSTGETALAAQEVCARLAAMSKGTEGD